jgi:hypothetical protein
MKKYISIVIMSFLIIGCGGGIEAGDGKKIGQIVKLGKHGMFCPTYEGEIIRGGFNGGSGVNGAALDFTIKSQKLYDRLMIAMENQQEIELHYSKRNLTGICYSDTQTIATGFKLLNSNKEKEIVKEEKVEEVNMEDELVND